MMQLCMACRTEEEEESRLGPRGGIGAVIGIGNPVGPQAGLCFLGQVWPELLRLGLTWACKNGMKWATIGP